MIALPGMGYTSPFHVLDVLEHKLDGIDRWLTRNEDHWNVSSEIISQGTAAGVVNNNNQSLRTARRVGLAIRYVISHSTRISGVMRRTNVGATYQTSALSAAALWKQALSQFAFPSPPLPRHHRDRHDFRHHRLLQRSTQAKARRQPEDNKKYDLINV
jgi:hypothetical protein